MEDQKKPDSVNSEKKNDPTYKLFFALSKMFQVKKFVRGGSCGLVSLFNISENSRHLLAYYPKTNT